MKELGRCTISTLTLELTTKEPVACKQRRLAQVEQEAARVQILEWLEAGVIRHSTSSYAAPITMPPKKDEHGNVTTYRLCGDFRGLNAVTRREKYPMPLPEEIFDRLAGKKYFSVLDLRSGFNQIPLAEADRHKTAFHGVGGHYEFNVMPFGLVNATAVFQRTMDRVLRGMEKDAACFVDDIILASDSLEEHLQLIQKVLKRLQQAGLKCHPKKCKWFQPSVSYLGHVVGAGLRGPAGGQGELYQRPASTKECGGREELSGDGRLLPAAHPRVQQQSEGPEPARHAKTWRGSGERMRTRAGATSRRLSCPHQYSAHRWRICPTSSPPTGAAPAWVQC